MENIIERRKFILNLIENGNLEFACKLNKETILLKVRKNIEERMIHK